MFVQVKRHIMILLGLPLILSGCTIDGGFASLKVESIVIPPPVLISIGSIPDQLDLTPEVNFTPATPAAGMTFTTRARVVLASDLSAITTWILIDANEALNLSNPDLIEGQEYKLEIQTLDSTGLASTSVFTETWTVPESTEVSLSSTDTIIYQEGSGNLEVPVTLTNARSVPTNISFSVSGGGLTTPMTGSSVIAAGQTTGNLSITIANDEEIQPIRTFEISLTDPGAGLITVGAADQMEVLALDNDPDEQAMIVSGSNFNCYKNSQGLVKCWGDNTFGQLGLGDTVTRGDQPGEMGNNLPYVDLGTGLTAKLIATSNGSLNTCALLNTGDVKCWGYGNTWNEPGYMGYGTSTNFGDQAGEMGDNLPLINLGTGVKARDLITSSFNSCIITPDHRAKCWGVGFYGANGNASADRIGSNINQMGNNLQYLDLGTDLKILKIAMGAFHRCAILDNLKVKCWGWGVSGALGLEDNQTRGDDAGEMGDNLPYVNLGTDVEVVDIVASTGYYYESPDRHHTCALLSDGRVKCWGSNSFGQLGYENTTSRGLTVGSMGDNLPFVNLGTGRTAKRIFASEHSTCAILDNDSLKCWGRGASGNLGRNSTVNSGNTINSMGDFLNPIFLGVSRFAKAVSGSFLEYGNPHRCALLDNYAVKCWGKNGSGELGTGNTDTLGDDSGEMEDLEEILIFEAS